MQDETDYEVISPAQTGGNSLVEMVTKADIDTQISTAKQYPRSITQFSKDIQAMCTLNQEVAQSCNYGVPRGGKVIQGPSVRFAELVLSAWGNSRAGARVVHEDTRFVTAQGVCHDLQRNTVITMEVRRRITDKNGKTYNDDMIGTTGNAAASIALRNAILRIVPKSFWESSYLASKEVAIGKGQPMTNRRANAVAILQKYGVTPEMILAKFEIKGVDDLTIEHLELLFACVTSMKEGSETVESLFSPPKSADEAKGNNAVKEKLKKESAKKAGADPETGEIKKDEKLNTSAEPVQKTAKSEHVETEKKPVFSTAQIGVKGRKDSPIDPDFDAWKTEFITRCNTAPTLPEIATLYKHNASILSQIKGRNAQVFTECQTAYNDNVARLQDAPE